MNFVRLQEPTIKLSSIQLWRHSFASNVKEVERQASEETSANRSFVEKQEMKKQAENTRARSKSKKSKKIQEMKKPLL